MELDEQLLAKSSREVAYTRTHVDSKLAKIGVELAGETQASCDSGHDDGDKVVEVTVGGGRELQRPEANVIKGFVIDTECLVGVLDKLVDGKGCIVWLRDGVCKNHVCGHQNILEV